MKYIKDFRQEYFLTAAECNPEKEMPLSLVMTKIIEVATLHANSWGVGYADMIRNNEGWVLSRVTIEMLRYPKVNEAYTFTTWIEDYNRHFSQRNMEITDHNGEVIGYARTIWMVINFATRESSDISQLSYLRENISTQIHRLRCEPTCEHGEIPRLAPESVHFGKIRPKFCETNGNRIFERNAVRNHSTSQLRRQRPNGLQIFNRCRWHKPCEKQNRV